MPAQLERELKNRIPNQTVEVVNFGVLQYTSAESFAAFALRGVDLHPDVVVIYEGRTTSPHGSSARSAATTRSSAPSSTGSPTRRATARSRRASATECCVGSPGSSPPRSGSIGTRSKAPRAHAAAKDLAFKGSSGSRSSTTNGPSLPSRAPTAPAHCWYPRIQPFHRGDHSYAARSFRENRFRQERAAKSQGGGFLDLTLILDSKADFRDPVHFTKEGARSVASKIATEMEKLGWLPK